MCGRVIIVTEDSFFKEQSMLDILLSSALEYYCLFISMEEQDASSPDTPHARKHGTNRHGLCLQNLGEPVGNKGPATPPTQSSQNFSSQVIP